MVLVRLSLVFALTLVSCVSKSTAERRETARAGARLAAAEPVERTPYRIVPGDTLRIEHRYNEELNRVAVVRPDGYVSLPLVPEVHLADRTPAEAEALIEEQYVGIVRRANVTVALDKPSNPRICVGGEVLHPGMFELADGLTALRAIALAGGPRPSARLGSVVVLRDRGLPTPEYLLIDLGDATSGRDPGQDLTLRPKDMVFVPRTTIAGMNAFVDQYLNQLIPFSKTLGVTYLVGGGVIY